MRRREFIAGLGGVAASGACAASRDSQNRCAVARSLAPRFARMESFRQTLRAGDQPQDSQDAWPRRFALVPRPRRRGDRMKRGVGRAARAIPVLAQRGRVGRAEGRQQDLTRGKYPRDLSPALFRDGYAQLLLRRRGCSRALWLPGIGGRSREPVGSDDAGTCARRQPLSAPSVISLRSPHLVAACQPPASL